MSLHDTIAADALTVFCNDQDFAETVTYWPRVGLSRQIKAVVIRDQITTFTEDGGQTNLPSFQLFVANTASGGISSSEIDTGGDKIELPPRDGKTAEKRSITQITEQDHGMLVIECR